MKNTQELSRLTVLAENHPLLPIGWGNDKKAPMLKSWQHHKGFSIKELEEHKKAIAVGLRCDRIFCLDFDGSSSINWGELNGFNAIEMKTWTVHRNNTDSNFKVLFSPTEKQIDELPNNNRGTKEFQFKISTGKGEQLEFFFDKGRQVIVLGQHFKSNGTYKWLQEHGPESLSSPSNRLWEQVIHQVIRHQENIPNNKIPSSKGGDWERLENCPICGRCSHQICQIHKDKKTIRCFIGSSYAPPKGLHTGEIIENQWAYCRDQFVGWGQFSIFVKHKPSHIQRLRRRWNHV